MVASVTDLHLFSSLESNFWTTLYCDEVEEQSTSLRSGLLSVPLLCMQEPTEVVSASSRFRNQLSPNPAPNFSRAMMTKATMAPIMRSAFLFFRLAGAAGG